MAWLVSSDLLQISGDVALCLIWIRYSTHQFFVYSLFTETIDLGVLVANAIAWIFATLFAFYTNRRWVFIFHPKGVYAFFVQLGGFCLGRLLTLGIEEMMLYFCIEVYHLPNMLIKMLAQIIVIALNYVFSKLIVFRGKK